MDPSTAPVRHSLADISLDQAMAPANHRKSDVAKLMLKLGEHFTLPYNACMVESHLYRLHDAFGGFDKVQGARVLDLGCGSWTCFESTMNKGIFEPWLCRAVALLGGHAVGVDNGNPGPLPPGFEFHHLCLARQIEVLQTVLPLRHSFTAINMNLLVSSPTLVRDYSRERRSQMLQDIRAEKERLLVPGGIVIRWDEDLDSY